MKHELKQTIEPMLLPLQLIPKAGYTLLWKPDDIEVHFLKKAKSTIPYPNPETIHEHQLPLFNNYAILFLEYLSYPETCNAAVHFVKKA